MRIPSWALAGGIGIFFVVSVSLSSVFLVDWSPHASDSADDAAACACDQLVDPYAQEEAKGDCIPAAPFNGKYCPVLQESALYEVTYGGAVKAQDRDTISEWRLTIDGEIDRSVEFSYDELLSLGERPREFTIACISSSDKYQAVGNVVWSGLPLAEVLAARNVSVLPSAVQITFDCDDDYVTYVPAEDWSSMWLIWKINGETLPRDRGYPLRVMTPGRFGIKHPKWVRKITFTDHVGTSYWDAGWDALGPMKPQSWFQDYRGTREPLLEASDTSVQLSGMAVCGNASVSRVQVEVRRSPDADGDIQDSVVHTPWTDVEVFYQGRENVWTLWRFPLSLAEEGFFHLRARVDCSDGSATNDALDYRIPYPHPGNEGAGRMTLTVGSGGEGERRVVKEYCDSGSRNFCLSYDKISDTEIQFEVVAKADGWVSFGFTEKRGLMSPSDVVFLSVDDNGVVTVSDRWSPDYLEPDVDAFQDYSVVSSGREDGVTKVKVVRRLRTLDDDDIEIEDRDMDMIWGYHASSRDFAQKHTAFGAMTVNPVSGNVTGGAPFPFVAVAWAVLVVLLVGSVLLAKLQCSRQSSCGRWLLHQRAGLPIDLSTTARAILPVTWTWGELLLALVFLMLLAVWVVVGSFDLRDAAVGNYVARQFGVAAGFCLMATLFTATRNTILPLVGVSFERALRWHRLASKLMVVMGLVHGIVFLVARGKMTFVSNEQGNGSAFGLYALLLFLLIGAMASLRRSLFNLFRVSHALFVPAIVLIGLHSHLLGLFLIVPSVLYFVDVAVRSIWKTTTVEATLTKKDSVVAVEIPDLPMLPGQWAFLTIPEVTRTEQHPYSLAYCSGKKATSATFLIKNMGPGTWTDAVHAYVAGGADGGGNSVSDSISDGADEPSKKAAGPGRAMRVTVEGPYGTLPLQLQDYRTIVLVGGGVGVTPLASVLQHILASTAEKGENTEFPRLERVVLIWACRGATPFQLWFPHLLDEAAQSAAPAVHLHLFDTAASAAPPPGSDRSSREASMSGEDDSSASQRWTWTAGKLPLAAVVRSIVDDETLAGGGGAMLCCGPPRLMAEAAFLARKHRLDLHLESFHL